MDSQQFDNLDPATPVDSQIPFEYRRLPDDFWLRPIRVVQVTGERL